MNPKKRTAANATTFSFHTKANDAISFRETQDLKSRVEKITNPIARKVPSTPIRYA